MELFFSSFFTDQNIMPILNKSTWRSCQRISRDNDLFSDTGIFSVFIITCIYNTRDATDIIGKVY